MFVKDNITFVSNSLDNSFESKLNSAITTGVKKVILEQSQTYSLSTSVTLSNIVIEGNESTISFGESGRFVLMDGVTIQNVTMSSASSNYNKLSLLDMLTINGSNINIFGVNFINNFFHYTVHLWDINSISVTDVNISNCSFVECVEHGILLTGKCDHIKIEKNLFKNITGDAIGGTVTTVTNIEIYNNVFDSNSRFGVEFYGAQYIKIHDNEFKNNSTNSSISLPACFNVDIYSNLFKNNSGASIIEVGGSSDATDFIDIYENTFVDNTFSPIIINVAQVYKSIRFNRNKLIRCTSSVSLLQLIGVNVEATCAYHVHFECANNQFIQTSYSMLTGNIHNNHFIVDDDYLTNGNSIAVLTYINCLFKDNIMEYIGDTSKTALIGINRNNIKVIGNIFKCNNLVSGATSYVVRITGVTCVNNFVYNATRTGITVTSTQGTVQNNYSL